MRKKNAVIYLCNFLKMILDIDLIVSGMLIVTMFCKLE